MNDDFNKRNFEDYFYKRPGTIFGDIKIDLDKKNRQNFSRNTRGNRQNRNVYTASPVKERVRNEPFLPWVDRWLHKHISKKAWRVIALVFAIGGIIGGIYYSDYFDLEQWIAALLGAIVGIILLEVMIFLIKLILFSLILVVIGGVAYVIYNILTMT